MQAGQNAVTRNDVQVVEAKRQRASRICALLPDSLAVKDWTGKVESIDTEIGGDRGTLSVVIAKDVALATAQGFLDTDTMIDPSSKVFDQLSKLQVGQKVTFGPLSGRDSMCIKETSLMSENGLRTPDFLFIFTNIH